MQIARGINLTSKVSTARFTGSKCVFTEISNAVRGPKIQWRGRSFAASVPSDSSKPRRSQKRLSKDERCARVKSFVDEYRASNTGKFPSPSVAKKHLGGSYYVIKQILQELEYKSKVSPISRSDETLLEKETKATKHASLTEAEEVSSSKSSVGCTSSEQRLGVEVNNMKDEATSKHFEAKEGPHVSTWVEEALIEDAIKQESKEVLHPRPEIPEDSKKEVASEGSLGLTSSNGVFQEGDEAHESDKFERNVVRKDKEEEQLQKGSTVWGNLKSLADGIINLWRKM